MSAHEIRQPGLNPGDRITLTIDATVVTLNQGLLSYSYPLTDGTAPIAHVVLDSGAVTVDHSTPANWPPQAGDLWRDGENSLWFVFEGPKTDELLMTCNYDIQEPPADVLHQWGPLTLVRRDGRDQAEHIGGPAVTP